MAERSKGPAAPLYGSGGQVPYVTPVTEERAAYNEVLSMYADAPDPVTILPAQLRSEVVLSGNASSFAFNFRSDQNNPGMTSVRPTENRLDVNDAFVIREMSLQFGIELITPSDPANLTLQMFPNTGAVPAAPGVLGGFGAASAAVLAAYNGKMALTVNTVEYMSGLDVYSFMYSDVAQAGVLNAVGGPFVASAVKKGVAYRSMCPQIRIQGGDKAQVTVQLPSAKNFGAVALYQVVAVLLVNGLRIGNGGGQRGR